MEDQEKPTTSSVQIPLLTRQDVDSDKDSIPFADSPESPAGGECSKQPDQTMHDGIILLITSDAEGQKSPSGSMKQHPLSDLYLLPTLDPSDASHRRHSLRDRSGKKHHYSPERKKSCPDAELQLKAEHRRRSSNSLTPRSEQDISTVCKDRLTPTSFYSNGSRRASNCSLAHSRRSSTCSMSHKRRSSSCSVNHSRRSSNCSASHSRRSSNCSVGHSRRSSNCSMSQSRRSSNCSRRSSHADSDEESILRHHHHHHHKYHRGSRISIDQAEISHKYLRSPSSGSVMSHDRRASRMSIPLQKRTSEEELEAGEIPARQRKIIIIFIGSVSIFILVMSVVLIAVSLTMSPTIDDLVRKENEEMYRAMANLPSTAPAVTESSTVGNDNVTSTGHPG